MKGVPILALSENEARGHAVSDEDGIAAIDIAHEADEDVLVTVDTLGVSALAGANVDVKRWYETVQSTIYQEHRRVRLLKDVHEFRIEIRFRDAQTIKGELTFPNGLPVDAFVATINSPTFGDSHKRGKFQISCLPKQSKYVLEVDHLKSAMTHFVDWSPGEKHGGFKSATVVLPNEPNLDSLITFTVSRPGNTISYCMYVTSDLALVLDSGRLLIGCTVLEGEKPGEFPLHKGPWQIPAGRYFVIPGRSQNNTLVRTVVQRLLAGDEKSLLDAGLRPVTVSPESPAEYEIDILDAVQRIERLADEQTRVPAKPKSKP